MLRILILHNDNAEKLFKKHGELKMAECGTDAFVWDL